MRAAALLILVLAASPAAAFPDGAPWEVASGPGCPACHFDAPPTEDSPALAIEGLPARIAAGATYRLTLRLSVPGMARAGFLIAAWRGKTEAGRFTAADARSEAKDATARSTAAGLTLSAPGEAEWTLDWQAPARLDGPIRFVLWANAANGDNSPLGDETHGKSVQVAP